MNLKEFNFHDWLINHANKKYYDFSEVVVLLRKFAEENISNSQEQKGKT